MRKEKEFMLKSSSGGFALTEFAAILLISATILVSSLGTIQSWLNQSTAAANQKRMEAIQQALLNYETLHNRLPCPSSFLPSDANYGHEVSLPCTVKPGTTTAIGRLGSAGPAGTSPMPSTAPGTIIIGALPVLDLGLPNSYLADSYGHMYSYAVTMSETSTTTPLNSFGGVIDVKDSGGHSILPYAADGPVHTGTALYVVVDHGKDGAGAYGLTSGTVGTPCPAVGATQDSYNCSYEAGAYAGFRSAQFSTNKGPAPNTWYDDTIIYDAGRTGASTVTVTSSTCSYVSGIPAAGSAPGHGYYGSGSGNGSGGGALMTIFSYTNSFDINPYYPKPLNTGLNLPSPTADALCPAGNWVSAGGCTQTQGAPTPNMYGEIINAFGGDIAIDKTYYGILWADSWQPVNSSGIPTGPRVYDYPFQVIPPPLGHPTYKVGFPSSQQGWECNGSSAKGMYTQAYAICCH